MILTVDEVKAHLRIEYDDEDEYLAKLIRQAQQTAEDYTRVKYADVEVSAEDGGSSTEDGAEETADTTDTELVPAPEPVRLACLLMVGYVYENRDVPDTASYNAMRRAFNNLLYPYREPSLMF